ncbi:hypothetical protein GHT06_017888 [Daphnia sinensis]|uniref:RGS domain-containing protein n=1 Tax=Daphnia sinensis TaxID=1820382 RepID=A0AAD5PRV9_9CRUS|nr:hypothetical protein GHT06_017888 [Daphnia sinensis]
MADPDLKSIPTKTLKKVIREGKLSALISSDEGQIFFQSYLIKHPQFKKYWTFYNSVNEIVSNQDNQEHQLVAIKECFEKHIAIGADSEDRVDGCLSNRVIVENLSKAISENDSENIHTTFKGIQQSAFDYLNKEVFRLLIPQIDLEYSSRKKSYTSVYYFISTVFAIICLTLTCLWNGKNIIPCSPPTKEEQKINEIKFLSSRKPLQLAKQLEEKLPEEVKLLEKQVESEQMEAIYKLMQKHSAQFGDTTMDDMKNQMQLYGF